MLGNPCDPELAEEAWRSPLCPPLDILFSYTLRSDPHQEQDLCPGRTYIEVLWVGCDFLFGSFVCAQGRAMGLKVWPFLTVWELGSRSGLGPQSRQPRTQTSETSIKVQIYFTAEN